MSAIQASIERQLGGTMRLHWRREGLVCEMRLPASHHVPVLSRDVTALRPDTEQPPQPASSARVLIVEDEPLITMSLTRTLEEIGCNVVGPAVNVDEGLRLIDEQHPDVRSEEHTSEL